MEDVRCFITLYVHTFVRRGALVYFKKKSSLTLVRSFKIKNKASVECNSGSKIIISSTAHFQEMCLFLNIDIDTSFIVHRLSA